MKEYKIFYTDENGVEHEINNAEYDEEPKNYYYIKLKSGTGYCFFTQWDIIATYEKFEPETLKDWGIVEIENGENFIKEYGYEETEMDTDDFYEDRELIITHHFEKLTMQTDEEEDRFYNKIDELKE
jgi:hypothetical protein